VTRSNDGLQLALIRSSKVGMAATPFFNNHRLTLRPSTSGDSGSSG